MTFTRSGKIVDVLEYNEFTAKGKPMFTQDYVLQDEFGDVVVFTVIGKNNIKQLNIKKDEEIAVTLELNSTLYKGRVYHRMNLIQLYRPVSYSQKKMEQTKEQLKQAKQTAKKLNDSDFNIDDLPL